MLPIVLSGGSIDFFCGGEGGHWEAEISSSSEEESEDESDSLSEDSDLSLWLLCSGLGFVFLR